MYHKTKLENGIIVVTESMPQVRSISMGFLVDAGPYNETPKQNGLAHLVEHTMFNGTSSRDASQISRMMDEAGGYMGAFTARDYTCYTATVLDDYRTYALDLMGDILLNSIFPEDKLETEKNAILREIDMSLDIPNNAVHALLKDTIWPGHPLGRSISGTHETVNSFTREDVIYFVHENYLPDRIIIAAAGNLDHHDFVAQVRDAFWRMLGQSGKEESDKAQFNSAIAIRNTDVSQIYFSIGIRALPYAHKDRYSLYILNNILGGGFSSRLYRHLREELGFVYHISSEYIAYRDEGLWVIEGSTSQENFMHVLKLILAELTQLITVDKPVDEEELWKAKMQIRGHHMISGEDTNTRMSRLATQELYFGEYLGSDNVLANIENIDIQMIEKLSRETLAENIRKPAIAVVGPEISKFYDAIKINELLGKLF